MKNGCTFILKWNTSGRIKLNRRGDVLVRAESLSPRHGACSGCSWRNGLQYER